MTDYKRISFESKNYKGVDAGLLVGSYKNPSQIEVIMTQYLIPTESTLFTVTFSCSRNFFESDVGKTTIEHVVNSFAPVLNYQTSLETELQISNALNSNLNDSVTGLVGDFQSNDVNAQIIGVEFGNENIVGNGYKTEGISDSFSQGFSIGFNKSKKSSHDALLVLYIKAVVSKTITSPRDLQEFKPKLHIADDKGDEGELLYNSFSASPIIKIGEERYGKIIWAVYSDSTEFHLTIGNKDYLLNAPNFLKDVQK
ncbi:hypothetical protein KIH86_23165 [Paenibacillus sp. HN-1]|nr:hypothetical protein [Paenibacillus sinensis]MBY9087094.1 hypothetical protein [Paenibacillus sinensis]